MRAFVGFGIFAVDTVSTLLGTQRSGSLKGRQCVALQRSYCCSLEHFVMSYLIDVTDGCFHLPPKGSPKEHRTFGNEVAPISHAGPFTLPNANM